MPIRPYSQAILANGVLYCSGQIAIGTLEGDISEQTNCVCQNISSIVGAVGMKIRHVVKTTCFLADTTDFEKFNEIYEAYFAHKPARSCVAVRELPKGALVEIEAIAAVD